MCDQLGGRIEDVVFVVDHHRETPWAESNRRFKEQKPADPLPEPIPEENTGNTA
jgi:hypothetical protein